MAQLCFNPCHAEYFLCTTLLHNFYYVKLQHSSFKHVFSSGRKTVWLLIIWLYQKPADLDLSECQTVLILIWIKKFSKSLLADTKMVQLRALNLLPLKVSCPSIQPEHSLSLAPHAIQDLLSGLAITENRFIIGIQCGPFITHIFRYNAIMLWCPHFLPWKFTKVFYNYNSFVKLFLYSMIHL